MWTSSMYQKILVLAFFMPSLLWAQSAIPDGVMMKKEPGDILDAEHDPRICAPEGIAVGGYDLVSYHQENGPVQGETQWAVTHNELTYLFSSEDNQRLFKTDPEQYLPRYSGWCAISLALGRLTCPDYDNFQIENGQLLLFETTGFTNGRVVWNTDRKGNRKKADNNYDLITSPE